MKPELLEALHVSAELIKIARAYFPKSVKHPDKFKLELASATIGKALQQLEPSLTEPGPADRVPFRVRLRTADGVEPFDRETMRLDARSFSAAGRRAQKIIDGSRGLGRFVVSSIERLPVAVRP